MKHPLQLMFIAVIMSLVLTACRGAPPPAPLGDGNAPPNSSSSEVDNTAVTTGDKRSKQKYG